MFTAADLLEALRQRRKLKSIRPDVPGQLPPGWEAWLAAMPARVGAVTGAMPQAFIDLFLARPLARPPRSLQQLNRWQSFATLWRQQWQPPAREERWERVVAVTVSGVLHLVFGVLLLVLAYLRFVAIPPPAGDTVVQAEFVGRGTPDVPGGGAPAAEPAPSATEPAPADPADPAASALPPVPTLPYAPGIAAPELSAETPAVAMREVPEPQPVPPPPAEQPVQVTEVAEPDTDFVLPPPRPRREPTLPRVRTPEVRMPTPEVAQVEVPPPLAPVVRDVPEREVAVRDVRVDAPGVAARDVPEPLRRREVRELAERPAAVRDVRAAAPEVAARDVPEPLRRRDVRDIPQRPAAAPAVRAPTAGVAVRDVPMPASPASSAPASASTAPERGTGAVPAPPATGTPSATAGRPGTTTPGTAPSPTRAPAPGAGPATAAPGSRPGPTRADDWGDATRARPGGPPGQDRPGLFNADGTVRAPDEGTPAPPPGSAPGTVEQRIADLDKAGMWLKRPPLDYTPTRFDRFWVPHETLLAEWVRKGIKNVSIPIPGTSKRIQCAVSLLQLGGACGISDPNLNEQPATARPPPDIPFKPELQEDNGSR